MATTVNKLVNHTPIHELKMIYGYRMEEDEKRIKLLGLGTSAHDTPNRNLIRAIIIYKITGDALNDYVDMYGG